MGKGHVKKKWLRGNCTQKTESHNHMGTIAITNGSQQTITNTNSATNQKQNHKGDGSNTKGKIQTDRKREIKAKIKIKNLSLNSPLFHSIKICQN